MGDFAAIGTGITFFFEHDDLEKELKKQIGKNIQEAGKIEVELPTIKAKIVDLEKNGRARTPEHEEAEHRVLLLEHVLENLRNKNEFLGFYAAYLAPGTTILMLSDVRELGFVGFEHGIGMIGHGVEKAMVTRKRGY